MTAACIHRHFGKPEYRSPPVPLYWPDAVNHCPQCAGRHWHVGRSSAECAICAAALPIATTRQERNFE